MQVLHEEQHKLSQVKLALREDRNTLEKILSADTDQEYKKEVFRILDTINEEINELIKVFLNDSQLISNLIKQHEEVKQLFLAIVNLSIKFNKQKVVKIILDNISIKNINIIFIVNDYILKKIEIQKYDKKINNVEIIKVIEEIIKSIKYAESKYLSIEEKGVIKEIDYYLYVIININHKIAQIRDNLKKRNKEFFVSKLAKQNNLKLNKIKSDLSEITCNLISHISKENEDIIITLANIPWEKYESITETIGETSWCRISYLDGVLELVAPSIYHEELTENFGVIIIEYCSHQNIKCYGVRSTNLKNKNKGQKGKQADASYAFHERKEIPDLAVEVNYTSGSIDDLKIYAGIGVAEVWIYDRKNKTNFYSLKDGTYEKIENSRHLKLLTPSIVNQLIELGETEDITEVKKKVIEFLDSSGTINN